LQEKNNASGMGIQNMNNRAKLIGASFSIKSDTGKGSAALITLPFTNTKTN
jgi:signal transduction histidine kinase